MTDKEKKQTAARRLGDALKKELPENFGFVLLFFQYGEAKGRANFISTAHRADAIRLLRETADRLESNQDEGSLP